MEIKWRIYRGLAGDPYLLLTGYINEDITFCELYNSLSIFNLSYKKAKRKIEKQIKNAIKENPELVPLN